MAKERLSKLQKRILTAAAQASGGFYHRNEIMAGLYGLTRPTDRFGRYVRRGDAEQRKARAASVAIARSVAGLVQKGLIENRWSWKWPDEERRRLGFSYYPSEQIITLTDAGRMIAGGLNVNSAPTAPELTIRPMGKRTRLKVNSGSIGSRVNNKRTARRTA